MIMLLYFSLLLIPLLIVIKFFALIIIGWHMRDVTTVSSKPGLLALLLLLCILSLMLFLLQNLTFLGGENLVIAILQKKLKTLRLKLPRWSCMFLPIDTWHTTWLKALWNVTMPSFVWMRSTRDRERILNGFFRKIGILPFSIILLKFGS